MTTVTIGVLRVKDAYRMSIEFSWTNTFAFLATSTNGGRNITSQFAGKRIFIFSIVLGAENLSYLKSIETHARAFLTLIILAIGSVEHLLDFKSLFVELSCAT